VGIGGTPGVMLQLLRPREREQAAPSRVILTESEDRSRSGGEQWKSLVVGGRGSKAKWSRIQSP
jgi:hypothetical protein